MSTIAVASWWCGLRRECAKPLPTKLVRYFCSQLRDIRPANSHHPVFSFPQLPNSLCQLRAVPGAHLRPIAVRQGAIGSFWMLRHTVASNMHVFGTTQLELFRHADVSRAPAGGFPPACGSPTHTSAG